MGRIYAPQWDTLPEIIKRELLKTGLIKPIWQTKMHNLVWVDGYEIGGHKKLRMCYLIMDISYKPIALNRKLSVNEKINYRSYSMMSNKNKLPYKKFDVNEKIHLLEKPYFKKIH